MSRTTHGDGAEEDQPLSRRRFLSRTAGSAAGFSAVATTIGTMPVWAGPFRQIAAPPQGEMVSYQSGDREIPAYFSRAKKRNVAGVLVLHEVFGLNDHIKNVADRIAHDGYHAFAPDLYARLAITPPQDAKDMAALRKAASSIPADVAIKDMQAALAHMKTIKGMMSRFASVGFCMGGGFSYQLATHSRDLVGAVIFYGRTPLDLVPNVACPLLGNFAGLDAGIPPSTVEQLDVALKAAGKSSDMKVYAGVNHGFFNNTRPEAYNADAAKDAWKRTIQFFVDRLG